MEARNAVEFADRIARRRVIGTSAAIVAFLAVQLVARPVFRGDGYAATGPRSYMWALNAGALLLLPLSTVRDISARDAAYLFVTPATAFALLAFAWLESRALRDG